MGREIEPKPELVVLWPELATLRGKLRKNYLLYLWEKSPYSATREELAVNVWGWQGQPQFGVNFAATAWTMNGRLREILPANLSLYDLLSFHRVLLHPTLTEGESFLPGEEKDFINRLNPEWQPLAKEINHFTVNGFYLFSQFSPTELGLLNKLLEVEGRLVTKTQINLSNEERWVTTSRVNKILASGNYGASIETVLKQGCRLVKSG